MKVLGRILVHIIFIIVVVYTLICSWQVCVLSLSVCLILILCLSSYLLAVAMARHKDFLVEKKRVSKLNLSVKCGSIKDVSSAYAQMMELTMPGENSCGRAQGVHVQVASRVL